MIDDKLIDEHEIALNAACTKWNKMSGKWNDESIRGIVESYLWALPKPNQPYNQAILYRKLTGME